MTRVWQSGFETAWDGVQARDPEWSVFGINGTSSMTTDAAAVRSGTYGLKLVWNAAGASFIDSKTGLNLSSIWARIYFKYTALPASNVDIITLRTAAAADIYALRFLTDGKLRLRNSVTSADDATGTTVLSVNTWYRLELKVVIHASAGASEVKIDGVSEASASSLNTGSTNVDRLILTGPGNDANNPTFYFDDCAIDNADYPGAGSIIMVYPNGDGTLNSWTSDGTSPHADSGDDWGTLANPDEDTTYLYAPNKTDATGNFELTSTPADFDAAAINAIFALVRARKEEDATEAAPSVVATADVTQAFTAATSFTIVFTQTTGDLVVIFLGLNDTAQALATVGDSFTNLSNVNATLHVLYKQLDGTEGGNMVVTVGSSTKACAIVYQVQGHVSPATQAPEISSVATGTSTDPDPPSITPTGGTKNYLFLAGFRQNGEEADDGTWCNSGPSGYASVATTQVTTGTAGVASTNGSIATSHRTASVSSEDPGTFNVDQSLAWRAYTVAIHPPAASTDTVGLFAQLRRSDESTAITTELTVANPLTSTSYATTLQLMTGTGSHSKSQWDAARLALRQDYTLNGGADTTARLRVTAVALSVDYIPGTPAVAHGWGPLLAPYRNRLVRS